MLEEGDIVAAAAEWPWAAEMKWGKRLAAVEIHLPDADCIRRRRAPRGRLASRTARPA